MRADYPLNQVAPLTGRSFRRTHPTFRAVDQWIERDFAGRGNISLALFVAAGVAGLIQLSAPVPFGSGFEMVAIAKNVAAQGSFADPFEIAKTGPTAVSPPLYPLLLALLFKLFGGYAVLLVAAIVNTLANAAIAALLPRVSSVFYGRVGPGVLASAFWILSTRLMPAWDVSYTVLGLLLLCLVGSVPKQSSGGIKKSVLAGSLAGFTALLNPSSVLLTGPWVLYFAVRRLPRCAERAKHLCVVSAVLAVVITPWVIRNRLVLGSFVFRTNLGMTLNASLNDCSQASLVSTIESGCYPMHHPNLSLAEASRLGALGEVLFDQERVHDAREWVYRNPSRFAELTAQRFVQFWFPQDVGAPFQKWVVWLATAVSIPGIFLMVLRRESVAAFVISAQLLYPAMYYVVVSDVRYRYPVLWISLLSAGYCIWRALECTGPAKARRFASEKSVFSAVPIPVEEK